MKLEKHLARVKKIIDKRLDIYLPPEREKPGIIHKAMRYSVFSGGKRIRPILAIESCAACEGETEDVLAIACAIEFIHTYSLIHDDLPAMDNDDLRRGKPTCHRVFGEANAILAGDGLLTLAFNIIAKHADLKIAGQVIGELTDAIGTKGMVGGQVIDLQLKDSRKDKKTLNYINRLKTSRLFEASVKAGAIAAGSSAEKIAAMADFGAALGLAFQIVDDIIDKEGYVGLVGLDRSRSEAKRLVGKAEAKLKIFGNRADRLREITDHLLVRVD